MKTSLLYLTVCFAMVCAPFPAVAQDEAEESEPAEEESAEMEADASESAGGDVLILKTGDRIEGFQILRSTHRHYILEGLYDPATDETLEIKVSRGQVAEVIMDDIDPLKEREEAKRLAAQRTQTTVEGARLTDRLYGLLEQVIGEPPLQTEGLKLDQVLDEINKRVENVIEVVDAVRKPPRPWRGTIAPDMTLGKFLESQITPVYPGLEVVFRENGVQIRPMAAPEAAGRGGRGGPPPGARGGRGGTPTPPPPPPPGARGGRGGPPPALFPGARGGAPPS